MKIHHKPSTRSPGRAYHLMVKRKYRTYPGTGRLPAERCRNTIHHHVRVRQTRKLLMDLTALCPGIRGVRLLKARGFIIRQGRVWGRCGRSPSPSGCPPHRSDQPVCRTRWPSCRCFPPAAAPLWRWHSRPAATTQCAQHSAFITFHHSHV